MTRRHDGRTTAKSKNDATTTAKNTRRENQQEHHQSKNDATTTNEKNANDIIFSNRCL